MGDYLKEAYDLRDAVGIVDKYKWRVIYCGKVLKTFDRYSEMRKFYDRYRSVLTAKEALDLTFDIEWSNSEPVGGVTDGI